jgi:hypothetical protein
MLNNISKNKFLNECSNINVNNDNLTDDMFNELLTELKDKMLYV